MIQSSRCKKGIKKKVRHIDDEIYLVVMMSDLYPADIDIILDDISLMTNGTPIKSQIMALSLHYVI